MLLLYCKNGMVVQTHDDTQNVPASAYGDGVQVIPWRGTIGELPPFASLGLEGVTDTGLYATPPPTKQTLLDYAAQVRWECAVQGITFTPQGGSAAPMPINTQRLDQALLNNLQAWAAAAKPNSNITFTQNNVAYTLRASDVTALFTAVIQHVQDMRAIEANCIADLNSASPSIQTYNDVEACFASVRKYGRKK